MSVPETGDDGILVVEAAYGSGLYRQSVALREAILRAPLGLTLTARSSPMT